MHSAPGHVVATVGAMRMFLPHPTYACRRVRYGAGARRRVSQKSKLRTTARMGNRSRNDLRITFLNGFRAIGSMLLHSGKL